MLSKFIKIYQKLKENLGDTGQTVGGSDSAPDGAMSSGPILDKGLEDPKSAIYTVYKKDCDGDDCEKTFKTSEEMAAFLESNDNYMANKDV